MIKYTAMILAMILLVSLSSQYVLAESDYDDKLSFAGYLEETLGHFWAVEQNLDDNNAKLALVHASHPIAELYSSMKPELKTANPEFDAKVQKTLMELGKKTGSDVTRQDAQTAIDEAKEIIQEARILVVGEELSQDTTFKVKLMQGLLKTSIGEYAEGVQNGQIELMAEFQDGSAFVWRSQQIFDEIKSDLPEDESKEIEEFYSDLWNAYDKRSSPEEIATFAHSIINKLGVAIGEETKETDFLTYVENIRDLLNQVKEKYAEGDKDTAMSLATKAYLDNFEYLESPLKESGQKELVNDMETMMRIELRDMIKNDAPMSEINQQVDDILTKMDVVAKVVPEFGTIAVLILVVGIISTMILVSKNKQLTLLPRI
ncbi:MAG: PEFG-CTERM sorting domain-containing protein [Nitrosarchaeum sp.]|nr:PEFG-CTERM sorting domain-containing protein [Nitrosarchaeum sp.]